LGTTAHKSLYGEQLLADSKVFVPMRVDGARKPLGFLKADLGGQVEEGQTRQSRNADLEEDSLVWVGACRPGLQTVAMDCLCMQHTSSEKCSFCHSMVESEQSQEASTEEFCEEAARMKPMVDLESGTASMALLEGPGPTVALAVDELAEVAPGKGLPRIHRRLEKARLRGRTCAEARLQNIFGGGQGWYRIVPHMSRAQIED
jgi:hypothetical protein